MFMHSLSRLFFFAAVCAILVANVSCSQAAHQDIAEKEGMRVLPVATGASSSATFNGRSFNLYMPSSTSGKPPLLIVLHGALGNASFIENALGMNPVAEKNGMMVAYLNGTGRKIAPRRRTWNIGQGCCGAAGEQNVDDMGYISSFIDYMIRERGVDADRIFLMGHSNGSMMAYSFACQAGGINGIVTVSGPLLYDSCPQGNGLRVLHVHGDADAHVPFNGGQGEKSLTSSVNFRSVADTRQIIENSGGAFTLEQLRGVGHDMGSIRKSIDLPTIAADFLLGK